MTAPDPRPSTTAHPLTTLGDAIDQEFAELEGRRAALIEMRSAVLRLRALVGHDPTPDATAEQIPAEHASAEAERLLDFSDGMVRSSVLTVDTGPGTDDAMIRDVQERIARGLVQRTLYPTHLTETASGRRWMSAWADAGEHQRLTLEPPSEFAVFGTYAVFATSRWGDVESGYVLIRNPMVVAAFASLFDTAYASALPVPGSRVETDDDAQLLELLALGMKDEAIARYLGWGLRTVRRRVARLMDIHDVGTRYQLGAAVAGGRGRLGRPQASLMGPGRPR